MRTAADGSTAPAASGAVDTMAPVAWAPLIAEEGDTAIEPYGADIIRIPTAPTLMQPVLAVVPLQVGSGADFGSA